MRGAREDAEAAPLGFSSLRFADIGYTLQRMARTITLFTRRRLVAALLCAAIAAAAIVAVSGGPQDASAQGSVVKVKELDNLFQPAKVSVSKGGSVRWKNAGKTTHNVKGSGFASGNMAPGKTYTVRFAKPGVFKYVCTLHPPSMKGTVTVTK